MDYKKLLEKYNLLLSENKRLIEENDRLKKQLGIAKYTLPENRLTELTTRKSLFEDEPADTFAFSNVSNTSDSISKIKLFMSLFKGRNDVYAKKWENKKKAKEKNDHHWPVGCTQKYLKWYCRYCRYAILKSEGTRWGF